MTGLLYLTDGTTRINLLTGIDGFILNAWTPTIPPTKQTWRESPLSDGRKLAMSKWANAVETISLSVSRFTQDDIISDLQDLRRLLLQAREYFIGGSDVPIWIEARGDCETNTRYAVICDWRAETDGDPYHKPFLLDNPAIGNFVLILERQHWRDLPPGQSTCVELSATQDYYDASNSSFVPTESADDCYVEHNGGTISLNSVNLFMGAGAAPLTYSAGVRFRSVNIPQAAVIIYGYVEFEADALDAGGTCNVTIAADDVDSSAVFTTYANFTGRARTTATAAWNAIAGWVAGTYYQTPDLKAVLQEVVSRPGWVSGNPLAVLFDNNASSANAQRRPVAWDHAAVRYEPHLYAWWYDTATRTFGRTATCNNEVYVSNKHNIAQLTHAYAWDNSAGTFSANLIGSALPFALWPAVPAVNDASYYGIATGVANSGPFCSLVFDISQTITDVMGTSWQYWNGAWTNLTTVQDNTNQDGAMTNVAHDTAGVNSVHWEQASDWVTTAVNGITGYWVRCLITGAGGAGVSSRQQNRDVYSIVTPYVDTLAVEVAGDIQALCQQYIYGQSGVARSRGSAGTVGHISRVIAGLRSYDRGSNFTAYINLADEQNLAGITVTVNGGTATFANDVTSPTGRVIDWTTGGALARSWLFYVTVGSSLVHNFVGQFRCFVRVKNVGAASSPPLWLMTGVYDYNNLNWTSNPLYPLAINAWRYIDIGTINLPGMVHDTGEAYDSVILRVDGQALAVEHLHFADMVIIPADECLVEMTAIPQVAGTYSGAYSPDSLNGWVSGIRRLDVDSTVPRRLITGEIEEFTTGYSVSPWSIRGRSLLWQPNERQRWWFNFDYNGGTDSNISRTASVQAWQVSRYLSMRGKR